MVTKSRRMGRAVLWATAVLLGLPAAANAQFQLFPNHHKHRQRPDCLTEPQIYKITRQQYFGYYPTCWQRFPEGWGCPCPNPDKPVRGAAATTEEREQPGIRPRLDDLGTPPDRGGRRPGATGVPELPPANVSPFDIEPGPVRAPEVPRDRPAAPPAAAPGGSGASSFDAPSINAPLTEASNDPFAGIPATPASSLPVVDATPMLNVGTPSTPATTPPPDYTTPLPMQAPQRRSMLGSLWDRVRR
jgi:hypothetical protein